MARGRWGLQPGLDYIAQCFASTDEIVEVCEATDDELSRYRLSKGDVLIALMADPGHGILVEEDVEAVFASYLIRFKPIENRNGAARAMFPGRTRACPPLQAVRP